MNDSLRWLRLYLGLAGALVFLNVLIVPQLKGMEDAPGYVLIVSLVFATLSVFCGFLMFLGAWLAPRLVRLNPRFLQGVILFRWLLAVFENLPVAHNLATKGYYLSLSLLILWTGISFFMTRMIRRLADEVAAGKRDDA